MLDNKTLINNIRELCDKHGIKITNLEKELGFGAGIISRWGNNADPSLSKIIDIANYFNVTLDEIVGRTNKTDDEFLKALMENTSNNNILWRSYDIISEDAPKKYPGIYVNPKDFLTDDEFYEYMRHTNIIESSYYTKVENGFISIYALYIDFGITNPKHIKLLIQPDLKSELIPQNYSTQELLPLWLNILYSLKEDLSDGIKADKLKNAFLQKNSKRNDVEYLGDYPDLEMLIKSIDTNSLREIQETLLNPEFQSAIKLMERLTKYVGEINEIIDKRAGE